MSFPPHDFGHRAPSPGAVRARDRGVKRVHSLTRWIAAAALAGTAALGAVYTHLLPGSSTPSTPAGPCRARAGARLLHNVRRDHGRRLRQPRGR